MKANHLLVLLFIEMVTLLDYAKSSKSFWWSNYEWTVRDYYGMAGPNHWSSNNVWVDGQNRLHLRVNYENGQWRCAEVISKQKFSHGTFQWMVEVVDGQLDQLDPNLVFGMFTYGGTSGTNEIDIEIAKWGRTEPNVKQLQYVVYPKEIGITNQITTFAEQKIQLNGGYTTHAFEWKRNSVKFDGWHGHGQQWRMGTQWQTPGEWSYAIPQRPAPILMNLWLHKGQPPMNGKTVEIVIHNFKYQKSHGY